MRGFMSDHTIFPAPEVPAVAIANSTKIMPVRRIFCVGRNYAAHAAEMGNEVDRKAPFYFTKSAHALCASGRSIAYPPGTADCHYEMEFVVAIGAPAYRIDTADALQVVWGYGCGIDLTRRDLQAAAKDKRRPWDLGKDFENAAVLAPLTPAAEFGSIGAQKIQLTQNGTTVQDATLAEMVWSVPEIISHLSGFYHLAPGDLIYTGTPAGVGPVHPGDRLRGWIDGLVDVELTIGAAE